MKLRIPKNPKTTGWARRAAIALLAGITTFMLTIAVAFVPFLRHFERLYPLDTQNLLSALTASVLLGLGLAVLIGAATLVFLMLLGLVRPENSSRSFKPSRQ